MIRELTVIIESIVPSKRVQCTIKYAPWIDKNFVEQAKIRDNLHMIGKISNKEEDWRIFRVQRNLVNNLNKTIKNRYYSCKINISKNAEASDNSYQNCKKICGRLLKNKLVIASKHHLGLYLWAES